MRPLAKTFVTLLIALAAPLAHAAPVSISALLGVRVASPEGERLGTIRDLAIDLAAGEVAYAILDFRDPSALDTKLRAVPLEAFRPGLARDQIVLDLGAEASRGASAEPRQRDAGLARASSVLGMKIDHPSGADYGAIQDLVVDFDTGRLQRAVVRLDAGADNQTRELPFSALRFPPGHAAAILTLEGAPQ